MTGLIISLVLLLIAAEGFTNGVEAFSKKYSLSLAGSILATVRTALPENNLPIVAIFCGSQELGKEISVGQKFPDIEQVQER